VTNIIAPILTSFVITKATAKCEHMLNKLASEVGLLNIQDGLGSPTKCDQNRSNVIISLVTPKVAAKLQLKFPKLA
jgi:hypothetical protein